MGGLPETMIHSKLGRRRRGGGWVGTGGQLPQNLPEPGCKKSG